MRFRDILKGTKFEKRMDRLFEDANMWLWDLGKNDFTHSQNVENCLDKLVPDKMKQDEAIFDKAEIFLLLYAVYLQDIGRGIADVHHEIESYYEIRRNYKKYGLKNEYEAKAVAEICYGHVKESERPIISIPSSYGIAGLSDRPLNLQFLAALLRLADDADHWYLRVPWLNTDEDSSRNIIRYVNFDTERWIIEFQTDVKEFDDLLKLQKIVYFMQLRLNEIKEVLKSKGLLYYLVIMDPDHYTKLLQLFLSSFENRIPPIQTVHISGRQQEIVRIAVVQFCFGLTESFPFSIKNKNEVKAKIFSALDIAKKDGANIVCLPELCMCEEWISEMGEEHPDMIIIGGSFYKDDKNICPLIIISNVYIPYQPKIAPSPFEDPTIMGPRMIPGDTIYRYETQFGRFVILICRDFDNLLFHHTKTDIDMIFCPSFNSENERFHKKADIYVEGTPSYILIANTGLHGGTSIFGQLNKNYFSALVDGGCKDAIDLTYKLCEAKKGQEEVIIADFNLVQKVVQVPTRSNPNDEIKSVKRIKKIPI